MNDRIAQTEVPLRKLFDGFADVPPGIREARIAALQLPDDHAERLRNLFAFDALLAIPPDSRTSKAREMGLSEHVIARAHAMLSTDRRQSELQRSIAVSAAELLRNDDDEVLGQTLIGTLIGSFLLTELLGEGGSSTVFRCERDAGGGLQNAALKLLRTGIFSPDARRRFRREQAILAHLTHPNIARLIECGVSSFGIPYIAMELVEGTPITRAADERCLGISERLTWFCTLCRTIQAAHASLIVHRDLKPSNVLITRDGDLKVLDFGIAKLLDDDNETTRTKAITLTPEYAAPEQFGPNALTTAVDVYSLGMMLGELLTGRRPAPGIRASSSLGAPEAQSQPVPRGLPRRKILARELRGDLDAVLEKALAVDPAQRYSSAGAFADDIERYLSGAPVRARSPSNWYRARKFLARHRLATVASSIVVLAVFSSLAIAIWQARVARNETARANIVRDFVVGVFEAARASLPRDQRPTPESLVAQASAQLDSAENLDPQTSAALYETLGEVWLSLSSFSAADQAFGRAMAYAASSGDRTAEHRLRVLRADGWQRQGRSAEAASAVEPLLADLRERPSRSLIKALGVLAAAEMARGQYDRALGYQREAAVVTAKLFGQGSIEAVAANLEIGVALSAADHHAEAIDVIEPLLKKWRNLRAPDDERYVRGLSALLVAMDALGRNADYEARAREIIQIKRQIYSAPHDSIARSLRDLAQMLEYKGDHAGAESLLYEALAIERKVLGQDHVEVVETLDTLGYVYSAQRRFSEAQASYLSAIASCNRMRTHAEVCARVHNNLGQAYYSQDRFTDAEREMQIALSARQLLYGQSHPSVAISMSTLANVAAIQGHSAQALDLSARAVAMFEQTGHGRSREAALARNGYADVLERAGRHEAALREVDLALLAWKRTNPNERIRHLLMLSLKGQILKNLHRKDEVRGVLGEIMEIHVGPSELKPSALRRLREVQDYIAAR